MSYDKQIKYSQNKVKTTWRIINNELFKKINRDNIRILNMNGKKITHSYDIANTFNKYFTDVADNIHKHIKVSGSNDKSKSISYMTYLANAFESPYPSIIKTKTTSRETEKTILSLK
jgi:hypothetical protein